MQRTIVVDLIDDDSNLVDELSQRLPSVYFETCDIDTIVRRIAKEGGGLFDKTDLIFIDTFYKDDKSDYYSLDFFEKYSQLDKKTKGKYFVLVSIDDVNERLNRQASQDIDAINERQRFMALIGKVRKHPYIEWGSKKGSKTDKIIEAIEKYAQKNKIYLYKKREMSFDEWINYIISLMDKTQVLINDIQGTEVQGMHSEVTSINDSLRDIIDRTRKKLNLDSDDLGNNSGDVRTILDAINLAEEYNREVDKQISNLKSIGIEYDNRKLKMLSHHFLQLTLDTNMKIYRQKRIMERNLDKVELIKS